QLAVAVEAVGASVQRAVEGDGGEPRRAQRQGRVPGARKALRSGLVAQAIGRARGNSGDSGGLSDRSGQREMFDELALALRGPAGMLVTGGRGFEIGDG